MKSEQIELLLAELDGQPRGANPPHFPTQTPTAEINTSDFISSYADYADVLEAPRILHEIVAIQLVAAALNRNAVTIPLGAVRYSLDLWALLLSGSGAGRSTTISMAAPILEAAGMQDLETSVRWGSAGAFFQHFAENPSGLHFWGEMAERLKMLNEPQFATVKEWLTDRYDNFKTPPPFRYRVTGKNGDTPPIEFKQGPRVNILATSSDDWFFRNLAEEDSAGGFLARWMIMRAEGERRDVPIPRAPDATAILPLAGRLKQIGKLKGEADLRDILPLYEQWYGETKRRFERQSNPALAGVYFNRHRGHVLKLAVIFEASQSGTLKISKTAWTRAVEFAEHVEHSIFEMLPTGMSAAGYDLHKIEERIRRAGATGITQNDLTRCFQSMNPKDREQKLQTLIDAGRIHRGVESSGGRPKTWYRHADFYQGGA
jgi:hypothetical protein